MKMNFFVQFFIFSLQLECFRVNLLLNFIKSWGNHFKNRVCLVLVERTVCWSPLLPFSSSLTWSPSIHLSPLSLQKCTSSPPAHPPTPLPTTHLPPPHLNQKPSSSRQLHDIFEPSSCWTEENHFHKYWWHYCSNAKIISFFISPAYIYGSICRCMKWKLWLLIS